MEKKQRKQLVIQMLTAGIITFCLLWLLFYIKKYVPFGVHSLASKDADFQYLDFLAYLKDVFDGKNNIDYSFSKSIGGACIGVFSYYLSSPFNLLLLLFDKSQLCAQLRVCNQVGGNPIYPRSSQPDNSESWDVVGNSN